MGTLNPDFDVKPRSDVAAGKLVRHSSNSKEDVYAITTSGPQGEQELVLLDPVSSAITRSTQVNGHHVAVLADWHIEPIDLSVAEKRVERARREPGVILRCQQTEESTMTGVVLQDEQFLDLESFMIRSRLPEAGRVAVTEWRLWVPQFSDGKRPAWRTIFKFPKDETES